MIPPDTFAAALSITVLAMLCFGLWPSIYKASKSWRFELFYFDLAFGAFAFALVAAILYGTLGDELTFLDSVSVVGKRQLAAAIGGGFVLNAGNMLMLASISLLGIAVAFAIAFGFAFVAGGLAQQFLSVEGWSLAGIASVVLVLLASIVVALAYFASGKANAPRSSGGSSGGSVKGIFLALAGGLLMGVSHPIVALSRVGEIPLAPYFILLLIGLGALISTLVFSFYFMNLPVQGQPIGISAYFKGTVRNHLLGVMAGVVWAFGVLAFLLSSASAPEAGFPFSTSFAASHGAILVAAVSGLLFWKEFRGAPARAWSLINFAILLMMVGIAWFAASSLKPAG